MSAGRDERAFILLLLICYFPWLSSVCFFLSSLSLSQSRSRAHPTECILRFLLPRLFPAAAARSCSSLFLTRLFPPRSFLLLRHAAYISQWFLSNSLSFLFLFFFFFFLASFAQIYAIVPPWIMQVQMASALYESAVKSEREKTIK